MGDPNWFISMENGFSKRYKNLQNEKAVVRTVFASQKCVPYRDPNTHINISIIHWTWFFSSLFVNNPKLKTTFLRFSLFFSLSRWKKKKKIQNANEKFISNNCKLCNNKPINLSKWSTVFYLYNTHNPIDSGSRAHSLSLVYAFVGDFPIAYWNRTPNELYRFEKYAILYRVVSQFSVVYFCGGDWSFKKQKQKKINTDFFQSKIYTHDVYMYRRRSGNREHIPPHTT